MPLQTYRYDPAQKYFYVNQDFSGGMNTADADTAMPDNQMRLIENMELTTKGSLVKRDGFARYATIPNTEGEFQGHFKYYQKDENNLPVYIEFFAMGGSIYGWNSVDEIWEVVQYLPLGESAVFTDITGLQSTRVMNSVVYNDIMLVATGSFLLEYGLFEDVGSDPITQSYYFRELEPYKPTALEYANVGANLLSDDPYNFLADGVASILVNEGIVTEHRTGTLNAGEEMITYLSRPSEVAVSIKWEIRKSDETDWTDINEGWQSINFTTLANKQIDYVFPAEGSYTIRSSITLTSNLSGQTLTDETAVYIYVLSGFEVTQIEDIEDEEDFDPQKCNFLLLYYDQIFLWGDPSVPNAVYISDVFKPSYMPSDVVLLMETPQEDKVTAIVYYMNVLIIFTDNNIFSLRGKTPSEFNLDFVNRTVGCVAPYSAVAVANYIIFLSRQGIYKLKTLSTINLDNFNTEKIDLDIWSAIPQEVDVNANATQSGLVYMLIFPASNIRIKWYYQQDVWAMDRSAVFDNKVSSDDNGDIIIYRPNGNVLKQDGSYYIDDDVPIKCVVETKEAHLGFPFHPKKFKAVKLNFLNDKYNPSEAYLTVAVDSSLVIDPEQDRVFVNDDDQVVWEYSKLANIQLYSGSKFGSWVLAQSKLGVVETTIDKYSLTGKGYNVKIRIEHEDNTDFGLLGYSFVFKIKKP